MVNNITHKRKKCFTNLWHSYLKSVKVRAIEERDEMEQELCGILGVTTKVSLRGYLLGRTPMTDSQIERIEKAFAKRGIND